MWKGRKGGWGNEGNEGTLGERRTIHVVRSFSHSLSYT